LETFRRGLEIELEHGTRNPETTNLTNDDLLMMAKIALAHLNEICDYHTQLDRLEVEAERGPG
jgi:hypothetical protein